MCLQHASYGTRQVCSDSDRCCALASDHEVSSMMLRGLRFAAQPETQLDSRSFVKVNTTLHAGIQLHERDEAALTVPSVKCWCSCAGVQRLAVDGQEAHHH